MTTANTLTPLATGRADDICNVNIVHDVAGAAALFDDRCNVVVLKRTIGKALAEETQRAARQPAFALLTAIKPDAQRLRELGDQLPGMPALAEDIVFWTQVIAELTGCEQIGVRLQRVEVAMCPRLHVDKVVVRLVSAFVGRGTEFVAERRSEIQRGHSPETLTDARGSVVEHAEPGDLVFLKGEAWPGNKGHGAVHRSPTATREQPRLVLTLDALW